VFVLGLVTLPAFATSPSPVRTAAGAQPQLVSEAHLIAAQEETTFIAEDPRLRGRALTTARVNAETGAVVPTARPNKVIIASYQESFPVSEKAGLLVLGASLVFGAALLRKASRFTQLSH
jgi:hypothetical protein